ncbi:MAG: metallophosphoesterase [Planctomycetota bacterium]
MRKDRRRALTRFVFIADTHLGAGTMGFHQQPAYPERLPELLAHLDAWITRDGAIDFVIHGGDIVDAATEEGIRAAAERFRLSVPVYLSPGNHDLTAPNALDLWLSLAPEFFPGGTPEFSVAATGCSVHARTTHWDEVPYRWNAVQDAHFVPGQLDGLGEAVTCAPEHAHVFVTHSPAAAIPPEQTGLDEAAHDPGREFADTVQALVTRCPRIGCTLGGHNHVNTCVRCGGARCVTASAFVETPFEFKLVEAGTRTLKMSTVSLLPQVGFDVDYDAGGAFVQGRARDRAFEIAL